MLLFKITIYITNHLLTLTNESNVHVVCLWIVCCELLWSVRIGATLKVTPQRSPIPRGNRKITLITYRISLPYLKLFIIRTIISSNIEHHCYAPIYRGIIIPV